MRSHIPHTTPEAFWRTLGAPARVLRDSPRLRAARRPASVLFWTMLVVFIAWDVGLALDPIDGNTWSEAARRAGRCHPVVPFLLAALVGHLFHPLGARGPLVPANAAATVMGVIIIGLAALGFADVSRAWPVTVLAALGLAMGALLWPRPRGEVWSW